MKSSLPSAITKVTTMRDRTVRLQVDCQEIPPEHMAELFALNDKLGWFFFREKPISEIKPDEMPDIGEPPSESWEKTPGQRLRSSLYRLWEQSHPTKDKTFEEYYREQMEKLIGFVKGKLA